MPAERAIPETLEVVHREGITLAAFSSVDVDTLRTVFADPEVQRWNPAPAEGDDPVEWVSEWLRRRNDWTLGDHVSWAVRDDDDVLVGSVSLHHVDLDQGDAEIGYWVTPPARRRGHAGRAVAVAVDYAFDRIGLRRVYLYHATANVASCRIADRCGFLLEGTLRESHRYGDDVYHDEHIHGRLATDARPG